MKKYIYITAVTLVMLSACKNGTKEELAIRERDSLITAIDERETTVNQFISSFNEVERNLDSVSSKQHIILMNSDKSEFKQSQKARINAEINSINKLMETNNKKIKQLHRKLNHSDKKNIELEKTIVVLNERLNQKYAELTELNERLNKLNAEVAQLQISVENLAVENIEQTQTISEKTAELHTAYYIVGSSKDFQQWNLIDKEGGLLGIGQTAKVSNNLDMNMFTKIDYNQVTTIPINSKHIKIISTHPTGSFSLDKTGKMVNNIMISDPAVFWSVSKYLVVTK